MKLSLHPGLQAETLELLASLNEALAAFDVTRTFIKTSAKPKAKTKGSAKK